MNRQFLGTAIALLTPLFLNSSALAEKSETTLRENTQTAQVTLTSEQVINACVEGRTETLPIPFKDLSPNDWAFKAVMNLYYCGVIGPNTPPEVIERLRKNQNIKAGSR